MSLWLKDIVAGATTQILPPVAEGYKGLQFSLDGKWIYYLTTRKNVPNHTIVRVPAFGGTLQELMQNVISPPAVSPDGKLVAFIRGQALWIADAEIGGNERLIIERDSACEASSPGIRKCPGRRTERASLFANSAAKTIPDLPNWLKFPPETARSEQLKRRIGMRLTM